MLSTGAAPCQQTELQHSPSPTKPDSDAAAAAVANSIINDTPETIKVQQDDCVDVVVNIDSQSSSSNFHTKIREALEAIHCCSYCIYRFTHDASEAQLEGNNIDLDSLQSVISDSCCPCCIGILSHSPAQVTAQITELHESSAYQGVSAFNLGVRFPPHLSMRTRATRLYLENYLGVPMDQLPKPIELRDMAKRLLHNHIHTAIPTLTYSPHASYMFQFLYEHKETKNEYRWMTKISAAEFKVKIARRRDGSENVQGLSNENIQNAANKLGFKEFSEAGQCPPVCPTTPCSTTEYSILHQSIYVSGRYNKLKRHISNSPWYISGKLMTPDSVEGLIGKVLLEGFNASAYKFSSSGREDSDVLMLGTGRPFYFEMINPKKVNLTQDQVAELEDRVNKEADGKIAVRYLQLSDKQDVRVLKDSASTKRKSYTCLIWLSEKVTQETLDTVSSDTDLVLQQQTPTRVPRRAELTREKIVHTLKLVNADAEATTDPEAIRFLTEKRAEFTAAATTEAFDSVDEAMAKGMLIRADLETSAGTYVKEFVHGDGGRTVPCLQSIFAVGKAQVVSLDVKEIFLNWPNPTQSNLPSY